MSATYPDIDVTDPLEPVYDEIQDDVYLIEFCKEREADTTTRESEDVGV